jgi:hypothetical protein
MSARVLFDSNTPLGQLAAEGIDGLLQARAKLQRVVNAANAMIYAPDGPADIAQLETEFGIASGQGQQFFDVLNGAGSALIDGRIEALREIDQG